MLVDAVESGLYWFNSYFLEADADTLCRLRAPCTDEAFVTTTDDLCSVVRIMGAKNLVGEHEAELMGERLDSALKVAMRAGNGRQHSYAFGFRSNPKGASRQLREMFDPMVNTAKRFGAERQEIFVDRLRTLTSVCVDETVYLVVFTLKQGLSPNDLKRNGEWREKAGMAFAKASPGTPLSDEFAQNPKMGVPLLLPRHEAMLSNLLNSLNGDLDSGGVGVLAEVMEVHAAVAMMRRHLGADEVPAKWRPRLVGDVQHGVKRSIPKSTDAMLPMRIGRQMVTSKFTEHFGDFEMCSREGVWYGSVVMEQCPETGSERFSVLAGRIGRQIPWTVNFEITPDGLETRKIEQLFASFFGGFGDQNRRVKAGWTNLKELRKAGETIVALRATFTTWGKTEQECVDNLSFLKSSIESWGSAVASNETAAMAMAALASCAGFSSRTPAPYLPAPLSELARMLPAYRPASIWSYGHLVACTNEGRPYPVKFGTSEQDFWGTGIFAPSGRGKSFLMNMLNLGILFSPGLTEVPSMVVIDVGPSSRLVMDLARAMLPKSMASQIVSLRIRNDPRYAVNPFDTQLGLDQPTPSDQDFLQVVLDTICPGLGPDGPKLVGQAIRQAYKMLGRDSPNSRHWQSTYNLELERKRIEAGIPYEQNRTRVWDLVDAFFAKGMVEEATSIQRYASPLLSDLITAVNEKEISGLFATATTESGEAIIPAFIRAVTTGIQEYQLISNVTQFDVGNARAISIDLEEVVSAASEEGRRKSALMYMFARRLGARNFFLRWEEELRPLTPPQYHEYHSKRVLKMQEQLKFLEYDEVHNATGIPSLQRLLQKDLREGRKYTIVTVMTSQMLDDFPRAAVENCFNFFVLGVGSNDSSENVRKTFSLSQSEVKAIERECTGPGRLFGLFKTRRGTISQTLRTHAGPFERWAFNTDGIDATLRRQLAERMGDYLGCLQLLASEFPSGTARPRIDAMKNAAGMDGNDAATDGYVKTLIDRLLKKRAQELGADMPDT